MNRINTLLFVVFTSFLLPSKGFAQTVINELMASNDLVYYDDFFEFDDWIEIYHQGGVLNLAGYYLSDDQNNLTKWQIPSTNAGVTTVLPGDHIIFWCDNDVDQGEDHVGFKLSPDGEGVFLTDPDGVTIIDSIIFPMQQTDVSYGRECDGCDDWIYFNVATPDAQNMFEIAETPLLYINEMQVENTTTLIDENLELEPWIEIYNPNDFQVNLSSYTLSDGAGQSCTFPNDAPFDLTVEAGGFLLLWLDGEPNEGGHHLDFTPSDNNLTLTGPDGIVAAGFIYEAGLTDTSYGREFDGSPSMVWFNVPTPRVTNSLNIIEPESVVINELMSINTSDTIDASGVNEDWFEIHNLSNHSVDIGGYYLTDKLNQPNKYQIPTDIPDSTTIPPNSFVLIFADEDNAEGWNHTNFKFNELGEYLVMRSVDGFSIADSVHFGEIPVDHSWGRDIDGTGPWRMFTPSETTPEYCNVCTDGVNLIDDNESQFFPTIVEKGGVVWSTTNGSVFNLMGAQVMDLNRGEGWYEISLSGGTYLFCDEKGVKTTKIVVVE